MLALGLVFAIAPPATAAAREGPGDAAAQQRTIVLLGVDGPDAAERADAISAHVHGLAALVASSERPAHEDAEAWFELAIRVAQRQSAVAVLWVEAEGDTHYVLSVVRPERREIRWRRLAIDPAAPSAGLEALGIITRATTSALLADTALQMETTPIPEAMPTAAAPATPTPTPPAAAPRPRGRAVLAAGYTGTSYAREIPWQSGIGLEGGWAWPFGLHAIVGYTIYQRARAESSLGRLELTRHPIVALVGYHRRARALGYGADAGLVLDATRRHATTGLAGVEAGRDRGRLGTAITARARGSVIVAWRVELFVAVGLEAWLSQVRYAVQHAAGDLGVVLTPRRLRATVAAGFTLRL